jgi:hypothetical protein
MLSVRLVYGSHKFPLGREHAVAMNRASIHFIFLIRKQSPKNKRRKKYQTPRGGNFCSASENPAHLTKSVLLLAFPPFSLPLHYTSSSSLASFLSWS